MLADYFTKPLQGNVFGRFRDVIMGKTHINDLLLDPNFKVKERVEKVSKIMIKKSEPKRHVSKKHVSWAEVVRNGQTNEMKMQRGE